jgi:asparagine synthase (glutamine-hydrolysing)
MCDSIRHRGPDDEGVYVRDDVALGMRRLSIIDVTHGQQPIANEDRTAWVVFNGEIYNHHELQRSLQRAGHRFSTASDTEAIIHGYEEHGDRVTDGLRGMFAFAIWDERRRRLLLARDRLGIKPLYYWSTPSGLAFASELRALLNLREFTPEVDETSVGWFLSLGYVPDDRAIFRGVKKLRPGHRLSWTAEEGVRIERYWAPPRVERARVDERDVVAELRSLISECVESHLESEVPLGAFLSGGIDSSTVVAYMARHLSQPVRTFSIGFDEPEYDETKDAAAVARALGTSHTQLIVRPDAEALIEHVVGAFDEPFGDSSALPTLLVSQLARQHVTVALSGDGGDELFCGYTRYLDSLRRTEIANDPARRAARRAIRLLPLATPGRNRLIDLTLSRRGRYASTVAFQLDVALGGVARPEIVARVPRFDSLLGEWFDEAGERDYASQLTLVDIQTYLPGDILTKVDRMSMAVSLEARVPLLDHRLVEFAVSLPSSLKVRDGVGKWILRRAIEGIVPAAVLTRPKQGFAVPFAKWFRRELRHRVERLCRETADIGEYVVPEAVRRIAAEHFAGRRDHSWLLWRLMALDGWLAALGAGTLARSIAPSVDAKAIVVTASR